jgi:2,4-didehydro-3-deoxy-L-rhamnonate hydrolase
MRLVRFGEWGSERPGILDRQGRIRDLSRVVPDVEGSTLSPANLDRLRALDPEILPPVEGPVRLGACVGAVRNIVCIGLNYSDHAVETNTPIPSQPVVFNKHTGALSGPNDPVIVPPGAKKLDWEVELAVVMGRPCWHVSEANALDFVAGYCVVNDVSERTYQIEMEGQWTKGKSSYSFAPCGPWLVTTDEVPDPQALDLWLEINGKRVQSGNTRTMIFSVATLISYLSRFMALQPGDIVITGTPPGVGLGHKPPVFLQVGDVMRAGVQGLGEQEQRVVPYAEPMGAAWARGEFPIA